MNKIKNLISKTSGEIKELVKKFPLTMCIILFVTMLFTIAIDQDFSKSTEEWLEKIYLFSGIWMVGTIFTEVYFVRKLNKIISYGLTGGISVIFTHILTSPMAKNTGEISVVLRFLVAYGFVLILLSIYKTIKNEKLTFEEYVLKLFKDLFHVTVTYIILNIGIMLLTVVFVELILDGKYGSSIERLFALLFGLFYVPSIIYTFSGISKKEANAFIKGLILYVLLPLVTIAITIIYVYIAKIIILRNMPKNVIFRILAGIFIVAFPVWNMASNYKENKKAIEKIVKILPYLYVPFIFLEIYSIGVRISKFGITPMRYISCVIIVFQILVLGLTFYKKSKRISDIFICASILVIISFVTPFNYENISNWSQKRIIEKVMPENTNFDELSNEDKTRVNSAYKYLKYDASNGEDDIPQYLSDEDKSKIEKYTDSERERYNYPSYISLDCELDLNIEEYSKIMYVNGKNEDFIISLDETNREIDLKSKIDELISKNETNNSDLEDDFKENNIISISKTEDLYISELSFSYDKATHELNYLYMEGYLLERAR